MSAAVRVVSAGIITQSAVRFRTLPSSVRPAVVLACVVLVEKQFGFVVLLERLLPVSMARIRPLPDDE